MISKVPLSKIIPQKFRFVNVHLEKIHTSLKNFVRESEGYLRGKEAIVDCYIVKNFMGEQDRVVHMEDRWVMGVQAT